MHASRANSHVSHRMRPLTRRAAAADANGRRVRRRLEAAERRVQVRR